MRNLFHSFVYAFRGVVWTVKNERNMRIHLCFAFYVVLAALITRLSVTEWAAVLICIASVTALECVNTSLERLCDTLHPDKSEGIRHAKDIAAGGVLCAAAVSAAVGCIIFFREEKLENVWRFTENNPAAAAAVIITLIPLSLFVWGFRGRK